MMNAGSAQIISSVLGAIASIVVAIITGVYTVRATQVKLSEKVQVNPIKIDKQPHPWLAFVFYAFLLALIEMPIGFGIAYADNWLSKVPQHMLFPNSIAPALISGIFGFTTFLLGSWIATLNLGRGSVFLLFLIVGIFSAPVGFSLAFIDNWLSGVPINKAFSDSIDSLIISATICAVSFLLGSLIGKRYSKKNTG